MSTPNTYTRSPACEATGGRATQNVVFAWADGSRGELIALMQWAGARLLLLVFGDLTGPAAQRLQKLSKDTELRCVQVIAPGGSAAATEHVIDTQGHLQATCHVFGHAWALLRPDGYLVATGESVDASLGHALTTALGMALGMALGGLPSTRPSTRVSAP